MVFPRQWVDAGKPVCRSRRPGRTRPTIRKRAQVITWMYKYNCFRNVFGIHTIYIVCIQTTCFWTIQCLKICILTIKQSIVHCFVPLHFCFIFIESWNHFSLWNHIIFNEITLFRCSIMKFHDFEISLAQLETVITRTGDVQIWQKWYRSKALTHNFRSVPFSLTLDSVTYF